MHHLHAAVASKLAGLTDGDMWQLYRSAVGIPLNRHFIEDTVFVDIEDGFTTDFDSVGQFEEFTNKAFGISP